MGLFVLAVISVVIICINSYYIHREYQHQVRVRSSSDANVGIWSASANTTIPFAEEDCPPKYEDIEIYVIKDPYEPSDRTNESPPPNYEDIVLPP